MYSPLSADHEAALRYLLLVEEAESRHVASAVAAQARSGMFGGVSLSLVYGYHHLAGDLVQLGLATKRGDLFAPTAAGHRAVRNLDASQQAQDTVGAGSSPVVIVGVAREPVFYLQLLQHLAERDDILVVDPYLGYVDVQVLGKLESVTRILTGGKAVADRRESNSGTRLQQLGIAAGSSDRLEIRVSKNIHDRYMLPASGTGFMLGASLGGGKITTAVELSADATADLRNRLDVIWLAADVVEPIRPPTT
jgi:hypothetical protein